MPRRKAITQTTKIRPVTTVTDSPSPLNQSIPVTRPRNRPMSPTLFVEGFSLQGASALKPDAPVRVVAQFELFVLRARR